MTDDPDLSDPSLYINRELSRLAFNERVLAQARSEAHPLLDRAETMLHEIAGCWNSMLRPEDDDE